MYNVEYLRSKTLQFVASVMACLVDHDLGGARTLITDFAILIDSVCELNEYVELDCCSPGQIIIQLNYVKLSIICSSRAHCDKSHHTVEMMAMPSDDCPYENLLPKCLDPSNSLIAGRLYADELGTVLKRIAKLDLDALKQSVPKTQNDKPLR